MDHPTLGTLEPFEEGGWATMLSLPAFRPFYERWAPDGTEWNLERDLDHLAGRFRAELTPILDERPGQRGKAGPPSAGQLAAVEYLLENQERVVLEIANGLALQAPTVFHWGDVLTGFTEETIPKLAIPSWIMQIVCLQSVVVGFEGEDGCANVGFSFHSEILDVEHGVAVVMHRDRVLRVGIWDELDELIDRAFHDDDEDEEEDEDEAE